MTTIRTNQAKLHFDYYVTNTELDSLYQKFQTTLYSVLLFVQ